MPSSKSDMRWRSEWHAPVRPTRTSNLTRPDPAGPPPELGVVLPASQSKCLHHLIRPRPTGASRGERPDISGRAAQFTCDHQGGSPPPDSSRRNSDEGWFLDAASFTDRGGSGSPIVGAAETPPETPDRRTSSGSRTTPHLDVTELASSTTWRTNSCAPMVARSIRRGARKPLRPRHVADGVASACRSPDP